METKCKFKKYFENTLILDKTFLREIKKAAKKLAAFFAINTILFIPHHLLCIKHFSVDDQTIGINT